MNFLIAVIVGWYIVCIATSRECDEAASKPTCASDRQVYANRCIVKEKNLTTASWCNCKCTFACFELYQPVCGSDGIIYSNRCFLLTASCKVKGSIVEAEKSKCCTDENASNEFCKNT